MKSIFKSCLFCHQPFKVFHCHFKRHLFCSKVCKEKSTHLSIKVHKYKNDYKCLEIKIAPKKWMKYHRYLMEKKLGRKLASNEIVHHIDENPMNNQIDNLTIVTRSTHRLCHQKLFEWTCHFCGAKFHRNGKTTRKFCSLSCTARYGNKIRKLTHSSIQFL